MLHTHTQDAPTQSCEKQCTTVWNRVDNKLNVQFWYVRKQIDKDEQQETKEGRIVFTCSLSEDSWDKIIHYNCKEYQGKTCCVFQTQIETHAGVYSNPTPLAIFSCAIILSIISEKWRVRQIVNLQNLPLKIHIFNYIYFVIYSCRPIKKKSGEGL